MSREPSMSSKISFIVLGCLLIFVGPFFFGEKEGELPYNDGEEYYYYNEEDCSDDCSGHIAGYDWALRNEVESYGGCEDGKSDSFIEGCEQYVDEFKENCPCK